MNTKIILGIATATILLLGIMVWGQGAKTEEVQTLKDSGDLVSEAGLHWHPELKIIIKGERVEIPANVGLGMQYAGSPYYDSMMGMTDMHTHDNSGTLHWEVMEGPVTKEDMLLGNFFAVWGKQFNSSCILDSCNSGEGTVTMTVNSEPNSEFESYAVKDKDQIEIHYE